MKCAMNSFPLSDNQCIGGPEVMTQWLKNALAIDAAELVLRRTVRTSSENLLVITKKYWFHLLVLISSSKAMDTNSSEADAGNNCIFVWL